MVRSCYAMNCTTRWKKDDKIKFHRFPKDSNLRKLWVLATRSDHFKPSNTAVLCEKHFGEDDYVTNVHGNRVLKKGVIPSIFNFPAHFVKTIKKHKPNKKMLNENQEEKAKESWSSGICSVVEPGDHETINIEEEMAPSTSEVKRKFLKGEYNGEESSSDDEFIESAREIKKEELDQNESDLCLEELSGFRETETFEKIQIKSNDKNTDKEFDHYVIDPCAIKKEINDVNEIGAEELLTYSYECPSKSEIMEQEEVHIKEDILKSEKNFDRESQFQYESIQQLEVHIKGMDIERERLNKKPQKPGLLHQCPECPYSALHKRHLKIHSIKHKNPDEVDWYRCQECPYKTALKGSLKGHIEIHNKLMLKCSKCSYETLKPAKLKQHEIEHKPNIRWLHCPKCSFKTHLQWYIRRHFLTHKSDEFKCTKCPYQTGRKGDLNKHQVKHESMDKWHHCPVCSYKTSYKSALKSHCVRRHSCEPDNSKQIKFFKCAECPFETGFKSSLRLHELTHDRSSWFQCSDCAYKTPYKSGLKHHQVRRHQGKDVKGWHRCLQCPHKAPSYSSLQRHVISHKSADEIKWFKCSQCSFKTAYEISLRGHALMHKGEQEIEWLYCYECAFKTKHKKCLTGHVLNHKKRQQKLFTR